MTTFFFAGTQEQAKSLSASMYAAMCKDISTTIYCCNWTVNPSADEAWLCCDTVPQEALAVIPPNPTTRTLQDMLTAGFLQTKMIASGNNQATPPKQSPSLKGSSL